MATEGAVPNLILHGVAIPRLGFGTWRLTGADCRKAVAAAFESGYRHIDTAAMYGNEEDVGAAIRDSGLPRSEIFLGSKVWRDDLKRDALLRSAESSATKLGGPMDLLMVHWPNDAVPLAETMGAMAEARQRGLTRSIGVSNFPSALLREAMACCEAPILVNQCEYHPGLDQSRLIEACRAADTAFVSYRPLGSGQTSANAVFARIAARHGKTATQVVLRWHLQQEGVVAIPRSATPAHIAENIAIFDFELSTDEMAEIFALGGSDRQVDPAWAPAWDTSAG